MAKTEYRMSNALRACDKRDYRIGIVVFTILSLMIFTVPVGSAIAAPTGETTYIAILSGAAEVPGPGDADGAGLIEITLDAVAGEVCYSLT